MSHNLYLFNPTCDIAVGTNGICYTPPKGLQQFETDFEAISLWMADELDWVLVQNDLDESFMDTLRVCNVPIPQFIKLDSLLRQSPVLNRFIPWGWSMATHQYYKQVKALCDNQFQSLPVASWNSEHQQLFGRMTALRLSNNLKPLIESHPSIRMANSALVISNRRQAEDAIESFAGQVVFKAPWSSSGRGLMMVNVIEQRLPDFRWIEGTIRQQGFLMAEPFLKRQHDLSFHYVIHDDGEIQYLGHNFFLTNDKGKFTGCVLESMPSVVFELPDNRRLAQSIAEAPELIGRALQQLNIHTLYSGPIGVDAMWYQHADGSCYLQPVIETNVRYTMGLLNIFLRGKLHPYARGHWYVNQFDNHGFDVFCTEQMQKNPIQLENGKLIKGFIPLVPTKGVWGAWLLLK